MKNTVSTYRAAGLEARWSRTRTGAPAVFVRNPNADLAHQRTSWFMVTAPMFKDMERFGVIEGFDRHTLLADVFSIPA